MIFKKRLPSISLLILLFSFAASFAAESAATKRLLERNKELGPRIIQVAENVYTAIGYSASTNSMIVGETGVIIIDPGQQVPLARKVRVEFEKITDKPVVAMIYTHGHFDHTGGAPAFYEEGSSMQVWARDNLGSEQDREEEVGFSGGIRRSNSQGFDLQAEQQISVGIAIPPYALLRGSSFGGGQRAEPQPSAQGGQRSSGVSGGRAQVLPTHTFSEERVDLEIAGIKLQLVKAPGETDDQLYVWYPEQRTLFAGDNFYQSWPNVYPLRGSARRSTRDWIASIHSMVKENPLHVVGGHTPPILNDAVEVLTNYRDAIQYVYDKTIEGASNYMTPDELVEYAAIPEKYSNLDYLGDYYGSVEGTIRDIYAQDLGWFDGDALSLHRESPLKQSQRMADLVGGVDALMSKAIAAMENDDSLGAAQLVQHVIRLRPDDRKAKLLMADALAVVGERTFNAPARNYTLSSSNRYRSEAEEK
ncbi:MAG: alkyl/aryl-sulfatase [Verrucomicrobia bacterium]|nr:alkyl/aryl-sulfatase [Verrucomicrobiota bacterium]MDA1067502.1 alkyl/aryl-sulfatase [Verrucomicrobiota bacterium]